jgi:hypothetical protein
LTQIASHLRGAQSGERLEAQPRPITREGLYKKMKRSTV